MTALDKEQEGIKKVKSEDVMSTESTPGIIYISRIPPFMKPLKVRHIFSKYGEVGRVYLQPEGEKNTIIKNR